jgi:hypothetical protein
VALIAKPTTASRGEVSDAGCLCLYSGATGKLISEIGVPVPKASDHFGELGAVVCTVSEPSKAIFIGGNAKKLWHLVVTTDAH